MNSKTKTIIGAVVIAIICFFGGYEYGHAGAGAQTASRGAYSGFGRTSSTTGSGFGRGAGGAAAGSIIAKDTQSITIGLQSGGSKIVFIGSSVQVSKTVAGTADDLAVGANVIVMGTADSDGSMTAASVQIRPIGMGRQGQGASTTPATSLGQ